MDTKRICSMPGCDKPSAARSYCMKHYSLLKSRGEFPDLRRRVGRKPGEAKAFLERALAYEGDECLLWPFSGNGNGNGYGKFRTADGIKFVHRITCEEQNGPPPFEKAEAAHSCGNGHLGCVTKKHLSWKTHAENMREGIDHGTSPRGARNGHAKLTTEQVIKIRNIGMSVPVSQTAREFDVSPGSIYSILKRRNWYWLEEQSENIGGTG